VPGGDTFDGQMQRYTFSGIGDGGQGENQKPAFKLGPGATLKNVIIGPPAGDGVHCQGDATVQNVWWEDVGEDALSKKGEGKVVVLGGGAWHAADKVFQLNRAGGFDLIGFYAEDFQRLIRTNGGKNAKNYPYRIKVEDLVVFDGHTVVRSTNSKTEAIVKNADLVNIDDPWQMENGSTIETEDIRIWP